MTQIKIIIFFPSSVAVLFSFTVYILLYSSMPVTKDKQYHIDLKDQSHCENSREMNRENWKLGERSCEQIYSLKYIPTSHTSK